MKTPSLTLAALLLAPLAFLHAAEVANLRCDYLKDPLGIDVAKPRLSWVLAAPQSDPGAVSPLTDPNPLRGNDKRRPAYRLQERRPQNGQALHSHKACSLAQSLKFI